MSKISEFYKGKSVFLTAVTGFVGKALLEKLLRSCPRVQAIYCLVRPKKSKSAKERLEETLKDPVFEKAKNGTSIGCVQVIQGDIALVGLGLSSADRELLQEHVNVVLHCAATVRFDAALKYAAECNIRSVKDLIKLCHGMKHLESFVHVSTAFTNCEQRIIDEKIYPCSVSPQQLLHMIKTLDDDTLQRLTPELLGQKPNTYTLTKHLAEVLLQTEASDLPVSIVRPPVVTATLKEPFPGWISGWGGLNVGFVAPLSSMLFYTHCLTLDLENTVWSSILLETITVFERGMSIS